MGPDVRGRKAQLARRENEEQFGTLAQQAQSTTHFVGSDFS
jgi:hypothetical protein